MQYPDKKIRNKFQLDIMANPGNSGGPVILTKNGKTIGIIIEIFTSKEAGSTSIAMAVPIDYFIEMIKDI